MLISIIMPIYNTDQYLEKSIRSVLTQTFSDFELILIDDGSTDDSIKIIKMFANYDNRIIYRHQSHKGVASARNLGLMLASSKYITFMDSDDTLLPDAFEKCIEKIEKDNSSLLIYSICYIPTNVSVMPNITPLKDEFYPEMDIFSKEYFKLGAMSIYSNCNKLYRNDIIKKFNIEFDAELQFGEDRLFNYAYLQHTKSISTMSNKLYQYYLRNNNSLSSRFIPNYLQLVLLLHKAKINCFNHWRYIDKNLFLAFQDNDIQYEISNAINHISQHYAELSASQKKFELDCLLHIDYPTYFLGNNNIKSKKLKVFKWILTHNSKISLKIFFYVIYILKKL